MDKLKAAIDSVTAHLRYWALQARRRRKRLDYCHDRYKHFVRESKHWLKVWHQADKENNQARKARAKRRHKRTARKAAHWHEQMDDAGDGLRKAVKRRKRQKRKLRLLKKIHAETENASTGGDTGRVTYDGKPMAGWLATDLQKARQARLWGGYVVSGVRTSAQSTALCYGICGRPSCAGLCAGAASNHNCDVCKYPAGAADVTDYYRCKAASDILDLRYTNDLPSDRVHMSASGH